LFLDTLSPDLAGIVDQLGAATEVRVSGDLAVITIVRDKGGLPYAYTIDLIRTSIIGGRPRFSGHLSDCFFC